MIVSLVSEKVIRHCDVKRSSRFVVHDGGCRGRSCGPRDESGAVGARCGCWPLNAVGVGGVATPGRAAGGGLDSAPAAA